MNNRAWVCECHSSGSISVCATLPFLKAFLKLAGMVHDEHTPLLLQLTHLTPLLLQLTHLKAPSARFSPVPPCELDGLHKLCVHLYFGRECSG